MQRDFRASVLPCFRASVLPCFRTSVLPYFRASGLTQRVPASLERETGTVGQTVAGSEFIWQMYDSGIDGDTVVIPVQMHRAHDADVDAAAPLPWRAPAARQQQHRVDGSRCLYDGYVPRSLHGCQSQISQTPEPPSLNNKGR